MCPHEEGLRGRVRHSGQAQLEREAAVGVPASLSWQASWWLAWLQAGSVQLIQTARSWVCAVALCLTALVALGEVQEPQHPH